MPRKGNNNQEVQENTNYIKCPMCGEKKHINNFYKSNSPLYKKNQGVMVFCKDCVLATFDNYLKTIENIRNSIYITCMKFDVPFSEAEYEGTIKQITSNSSSHPFKTYMTKINSLGSYNNGLIGFDPNGLISIDLNKEENELTQIGLSLKDLEMNIELTEQDLQVKEDVIRLIGYDPFAGYSKFDQKFLYNELISYLDEDTLDDNFKLSQIIQLVNNNNQIRKIDLVINNMTGDTKSLLANQGEVKSLTATKKTIVESTDKIAKENSISVKNRGDKTAGKSTMTYLMKNYRELGFEDAEQDYYDQKIQELHVYFYYYQDFHLMKISHYHYKNQH